MFVQGGYVEGLLESRLGSRPSYYECALLSKAVYQGSQKVPGQFIDQTHWMVYRHFEGSKGYFATLYINHQSKHMSLAVRGTANLGGILTDVKGVITNRFTQQQLSHFEVVKKAVTIARDLATPLSFTGHSLGAWLAEQAVYLCKATFNFENCHAVTFESPGAYPMFNERLASNVIAQRDNFHALDVIEILSYPNLINTCHQHIGTIIHVRPYLSRHGLSLDSYSLEAHSIEGIVEALADETSELSYMDDWPLGSQYLQCVKPLSRLSDCFSTINEFSSSLYRAHFRVNKEANVAQALPLHHFHPKVMQLLLALHKKVHLKTLGYADQSVLRLLEDFKLVQRHQLQWLELIKSHVTMNDFRRHAARMCFQRQVVMQPIAQAAHLTKLAID